MFTALLLSPLLSPSSSVVVVVRSVVRLLHFTRSHIGFLASLFSRRSWLDFHHPSDENSQFTHHSFCPPPRRVVVVCLAPNSPPSFVVCRIDFSHDSVGRRSLIEFPSETRRLAPKTKKKEEKAKRNILCVRNAAVILSSNWGHSTCDMWCDPNDNPDESSSNTT